jgi:hypothetical protein
LYGLVDRALAVRGGLAVDDVDVSAEVGSFNGAEAGLCLYDELL